MKIKALTKIEVIDAAQQWVVGLLKKDTSGHDWYHIDRVRKMAVVIAAEENVDSFKVELMALLHEVPDKKLNLFESEEEALKTMRAWLGDHGIDEDVVVEIVEVISKQSYSKSGITGQRLASKAGQIVQDADRLEAIGAIGIARCFAYGGLRNRPLHVPSLEPRDNLTEDEILISESSIQHFYEKLLKVKDQMNTAAGKHLAQRRHEVVEDFLEEFFAEVEGER